jgi:Zn-dependent protease
MRSPYGGNLRCGCSAPQRPNERYRWRMESVPASPQPVRPPIAGWTLGHLWGTRVVLPPFALVIAAVSALIIALSRGGRGLSLPALGVGAIYAAVFLVSAFIHQLAHVVVARLSKIRLDDVEVSFTGSCRRFEMDSNKTRGMALTAMAGPIANVLLAVGSWAAMGSTRSGWIDVTFLVSAMVNAWLALLSVLPTGAFDGGTVVEAIVWRRTGDREKAFRVSAYLGLVIAGIIAVGVLVFTAVSTSREDFVVLLLGAFFVAVLVSQSRCVLRVLRIRERVRGLSVTNVMRVAVAVGPETTVGEALATAREISAGEVVVLGSDGKVTGHFAITNGDAIPVDRRATTSVTALMISVTRGTEIAQSATGFELMSLAAIWSGRSDALVVLDDGENPIGIVRLAELYERLGKS